MNQQLTEAYVTSLTGHPDTVMNWRVIDDVNKGAQAKNITGPLSEVYDKLVEYNNQRWGVFVCVNATDGNGLKLENISAIRAHVADLDDRLSSHASYQQAMNSSLIPHFAVQTSPDKFHLYWLVKTYNHNEFYTEQQRKLAHLLNGDKQVVDATRVLRVPGFYHCKEEPFLVNCWQTSPNDRYDWQHIQNFLAPVAIADVSGGVRHDLGDPKLAAPSLQMLVDALNMIDPNSLDRNQWMATSAAFKQAGWTLADDATLYDVWNKWCAVYGENDDAENAKLWRSFRDTQVGWSRFERVTNIKAYEMFGTRPPTYDQLAPVAPATQEVDERDNLEPILDAYGKQIWFKDCYFIERMGEIFSPSGRFMNATKFSGKYGGKEFTLRAAGGKTTDEPWKAALRATDWTIPKVDHVRFLPDEAPYAIIRDDLGRKGLNTYIPAKIQQQPGDVKIWLDHLQRMFATPEDVKIWNDYIAHCIKYPGYKIPWAPMLQSAEGIGKQMMEKVLKHCVGRSYVYQPKAAELVASGAKFNAWMRSKLLIIVNEIKIGERIELVEVLKPMITDKEVEVQAKGVDQEMEDNVANWIFFTNYKDAIPLRKNGRRYCVFFSPLQTGKQILDAGMTKEYFDYIYDWLENDGGYEKIANFYLNHPITKGALPHRAPKTSSYEEALKIGRSPIEVLIDEKIETKQRGFKGGYISYPMLVKAIQQSSMRVKPVEYTIKNVLEMMGYKELGFYPEIIPDEDMGRPPLLYGIDYGMTVNAYIDEQNRV